ncbi:MAG: hypothetical protein WB797_03835 [Nocardioides sp.]
MRSTLASAAVLAAVLTAATGTPAHGHRAGHPAPTRSVRVHRGGHDATIRFHRGRAGEAYLDATVSARGVSWRERGNESAVVSAYVDDHYVTDIVITSSGPVRREFALGSLRAGRHTLRLHYAAHRSKSRAGRARLRHIAFKTVSRTSPGYVAARYAPVLYGRNIAGLGGRFENNHTDAPFLAWHQVLPVPARPGHSIIEYSVLWSNEDGGTPTPLLMAQWGRTTDIEWVYRVEVNARGRRVPGSGVYQAADHGTKHFHGRYDGTHPLLETCTANNNMCDKVDDPMRFALSARDVLPAGQPREHEMDVHPWTYQVMAGEMLREHKIEKHPDPNTVEVGDQRTYLYLAVTHDTVPATAASGVGLRVEVRLTGDSTVYASDHDNPFGFGTINRNGPAATTVELPVGTKPSDIESISVSRVPVGSTDNGASLTVTRLGRAFFLSSKYLPRPSFARWHGSISLTQASPTAVLWPAP